MRNGKEQPPQEGRSRLPIQPISFAGLLESRRDELIDIWLEQQQTLGLPKDLSFDDLLSSLPEFITELAAALRRAPNAASACPAPAALDLAEDHGRQRVRLGFDATLVVREYGLLRDCALDLAAREGLTPTITETKILCRCVDAWAAASVAQYVRQSQRIEAEREAALSAAKKSEFWLRLIADALPAAVVYIDADEVYRFANRGYRETFPGNLADPVGRTLREFAGENRYQRSVPYVRRALAGELVKIDTSVTLPDGETVHTQASYVPDREPDGGVRGVICLAVDQTARRRWESEREDLLVRVQETERVLSTLVRNLPGMAYRCVNCPPWHLTYASEGTTALCGYTPEEFVTQRIYWADLIHPDDVDQVVRDVEVATAAKRPFALSYRIRTRQGEERWVWDRGVAIASSDGVPGTLEGFVLDVTERTRAEHETALLAAVTEASSDFVGIAHLDGTAFFINLAGRRLVGLEIDDDVTKTKISDYLAPASALDAERLVAEALEKGYAAGELVFRHFRTGELFPMWWPVFVIKDSRGQPFGLATVARDLREQKAREAEERRRAEFEQQLIGIVSHDLRNPLNAILMGAHLLLRLDDTGERAAKAAARIQSSAERAARMVNDLLDFTQARLGGGIKVQPRDLELHAFVRQVVDEVQMNFPDRDIRVEAQGDASGSWDADRVAQVVTNLVSNALRYSPAGTPVAVSTRGEGAEVVLSVHNRGPAIPPEGLTRLFEPMQRAASVADKSGRSVGLGLYIVKSIVAAHGGSVGVTSSDVDGTTFTVRLPRKRP